MASDDVRINELRAFFEGWDLYTTVIEQDYMIHTESCLI